MIRDFFGRMPPVVKNLVIINIIVFLVMLSGEINGNFSLMSKLSLYYFGSPKFQPYQIVTHFFAHANFAHLFFNMFGLVIFGSILERVWGGKRFLIFYLVSALGAMLLHQAVLAIDLYNNLGTIKPEVTFSDGYIRFFGRGDMDVVLRNLFVPVLGASGAIFGILAAFVYLFPNTELMFLFVPVPIKAKYIIPFFMVLELVMANGNFEGDNIAHFAHLGGALFGFVLVWVWNRNKKRFY